VEAVVIATRPRGSPQSASAAQHQGDGPSKPIRPSIEASSLGEDFPLLRVPEFLAQQVAVRL
jgi:hypothetical protein